MNSERKKQQRENNIKILAPLSDMDANTEHIFSRMRKRIEGMRLVAVFFKRARAEKQKAENNVELYLDDWAYQHGPITKENIEEAIADCVDRVTQQAHQRRQIAEEAEFRQMQGPLADSDDEAFHGLPDDAAFAKAILKQQPELKR